MKKILLSLGALALVLMGAGCAWGSGAGGKDVSGSWYLSFTLPEGWIMAAEYDSPREATVTPSQEISQAMKVVVLQSTAKAIIRNGQKPGADVAADSYVLEDYSVIDVYKLDPRFVISRSAEDLGNGFSFADGKYFFTASDGSRYQFIIKTNGQSEDVAKQVILSATLVTDYTGSPLTVTPGEIDVTD